MSKRSKLLAALVAPLALFSMAPAMAGPQELAVLTSYIGDWRGSSALVGGGKSEPFTCRLSVAKGNQEKVN